MPRQYKYHLNYAAKKSFILKKIFNFITLV